MKVKVKSVKRNRVKPGTVHLPKAYPWKVLQSLTIDLSQFLTAEDISELSNVIRHRDIDQLMSLQRRWGLQCINTPGDAEFSTNKARYQLAALLKKFQFPANRETQTLNAFQKFLDAEAQCRAFNREGWTALAGCTETWKTTAITYAKGFLQQLLGVTLPSSEELTEWSRHGPGATLDTNEGAVSAYDKFADWPYQCTSAVYGLAKIAIRNDARWLGALEDDYREVFGIPKHQLLDRKRFWRTVLQIVPGDRICFVPKNAETFRTITIGPTMNIFLQLGVDGYIRRRLKRWGVDLDNQSKNQRLARLGSIGGEDPFVTIDLKGASDTVSLKVCEFYLPDEWNSYLLTLRSPCADYMGTTYWLSKMSAMGNGFTFVLESAIFAAIIYGCMMATNGHFDREDMAVFGDDLVVRHSLSARVIELLTLSGFTVNEDKSFLEGPVRESCGTDWFEGRPIRPVFLENTPTDVAELFSDINRLKRSLALRWGIEESETLKLMSKWIPEEYRDHIGPLSDEVFDSHLHSASPLPGSKVNIGVWEYKRLVYRPQRNCAKLFHFRKLMHDLREAQPTPSYLGKGVRKLVGSGSRFAVHRRNAETVATQCSLAYNWQDEYAEALPDLHARFG